MNRRTIQPSELYEKMRAGERVDLIDVRTPVEYREIHARGSELIPLDRLDPTTLATERHQRSDDPLYVICQSGNRAQMACEKLHKAGLTNVVNVTGGTQAWVEAGLPVRRGRKAVSLERQVRIAAGLLVLLGVLLGAFVSPWFLILSGFVGAGLVFAGVTDTCGMGLMLARMPWNQVRISDQQQSSCQIK